MPDHRYENADFAVEIPQGWTDRTIIVWSAPASSALVPPNLVIAYDTPKPAESLSEYVNRQISELTKGAQNFQLELRRNITFAGRAAVEIIFSWDAGPGAMKQRQVYCAIPGGRLVSIGTTASREDFERADIEFRQMLSSFRWHS